MHHASAIRRGAPWLTTLVVAALLTLGVAAPAFAHDQLVSTSPKAGATVTSAPRQITLTFNDTVVATGTRIVLTGPSGAAPEAPVRVAGATISRAAPSHAANGTYTVTWRATSADGHPVSGSFRYTLKAAGAAASTPATAPPTSSPAPPTSSAVTSSAPAPAFSHSATPAPLGGRGTGVSPWALGVLAVMILVVGTVIARRRTRP